MDLNRIPKVLNRIHAPKTCLDCSRAFLPCPNPWKRSLQVSVLEDLGFLAFTFSNLQKDLYKSPPKSISASGLPNLTAVGPIVPLLEETRVLWSQLPSSAPSSRNTAWEEEEEEEEEETCLPVLQQQQVLPQEEPFSARI
jgi:hypothetical protein